MKSLKTPLFSLHERLGGKMVSFSNYLLPLQYAGGGLLAEHLHTRKSVSLFDVSHMGQLSIQGEGVTEALSKVMPADVSVLAVDNSKYTMITNDAGGIVDDLIISNDGVKIFLVLNASRKEVDLKVLSSILPNSCEIISHSKKALIALQGPQAIKVMEHFFSKIKNLKFMQATCLDYKGNNFRVSRTGYTGEDGFEISIPAEIAEDFCDELLQFEKGEVVKPAGLGARDSLRLEAGLCLYGQELNEEITPIEAGLLWTIPQTRRESGGFAGDKKITQQIKEGVSKKLVGLLPEGKIPVRKDAPLSSLSGESIGLVTSGVFSPSLSVPIAMGYVKSNFAERGNKVLAEVRDKKIICKVVSLPFIKKSY